MSLSAKPLQPKPCAVCAKPFQPWNSMAKVCGYRCAAKVPKLARKEEAAQTKAKKEGMKGYPELKSEAQKAFNEFIRARDAGKACICCGQYPQGAEALKGGAWDAGHYRSRGACPELAFDERNCHAQLKRCNRHSWDVAGYRAELVRRIGLEQVEDLERHHPPKHYNRGDLRTIRDTYRAKLKELK